LELKNSQCEDKIRILKLEISGLEEKNSELSRSVGNSQNWQREFI
jgi:FtsZ-binding cell division protein ZapB